MSFKPSPTVRHESSIGIPRVNEQWMGYDWTATGF
jgi:hypothetical protein